MLSSRVFLFERCSRIVFMLTENKQKVNREVLSKYTVERILLLIYTAGVCFLALLTNLMGYEKGS